jgi:hypothetical protein
MLRTSPYVMWEFHDPAATELRRPAESVPQQHSRRRGLLRYCQETVCGEHRHYVARNRIGIVLRSSRRSPPRLHEVTYR